MHYRNCKNLFFYRFLPVRSHSGLLEHSQHLGRYSKTLLLSINYHCHCVKVVLKFSLASIFSVRNLITDMSSYWELECKA